jgi:branched-chain amino acid transport system permease protein
MLLTQPTLAASIGPIVFVVVIVGGLGRCRRLIASMLIGILQTFAVAVDYSLLDLLRAFGVAVARARRCTSARRQAADRRADRAVPVCSC